MKKLTILTSLLIAVVAIAGGCANDPIERTQTNNAQIPVDFLFEKDGCKVYRFNDAGRYIYYTSCKGNTTEKHTRSNGKTTTEETNLSLNEN